MQRKSFFSLALIISFLFGLVLSANAATITWTGGGDTNLASNPLNWSGNTKPQYGDDVIFNSTSKDCTWDLTVTLASLTINSGYTGKVTLSSSATLIIEKNFVSPEAPSGLSATAISSSQINLSWTDNSNKEAGFKIERKTGAGGTYNQIATVGADVTTYPDNNGLLPGTTYYYRVKAYNFVGDSAPSNEAPATTLTGPPTVTTIGDYGNVTAMEITGNYDAKNPDGTLNTFPRQEIAREFERLHQDIYDFFVIFSNFDFSMPDANAKAFYLEVKNNTQGIGKPIFDNSTSFGSNGKLQGTIDMGNISTIISSPVDPDFDKTIDTLAHEQMHRWGANVRFRDGGNNSTALLGKDDSHWSFLLNSYASVLYGNDWLDNKDGTFTSTGGEKYYNPLDLYLMGMYDRTQVAPMLLIDNPNIDKTRLPEVGTTISGTARSITIDDIIAAEGERIPNASTSQKNFKTAFILITRPGTFNSNVLQGVETIRNAWAGRFTQLTNGKGTIMDIPPSITIAIASPTNNETIYKPSVTVKGAVINTTGNETGVTVNLPTGQAGGIVATVYGNQFIANHVPLEEGQNTITVTATDTAGNTATTSITVNAVTTGNYIKLTSNIESGISPLEVMLKIDGTFSITNSSLNVTGPVQPEITSSSPKEYEVKMKAEGIYTFTASATDANNNTYTDTIAIIVMNKNQVDTLLKGKWEGMKSALSNHDINTALNYYTEDVRGHYNQTFTDMYNYLPQFVQNMQDIQLIYSNNNMAKYRIRKTEVYGGQPLEITYYIYFVIDENGIWRIDKF